jgi:hypothetical protein
MGLMVMRSGQIQSALGPGPGFAPVAICDVCEGLIQDADMAMYCFDRSASGEPGFTAPIKLVHKGPCREDMARQIGKGYGDMEFSHLLQSLPHNTGYGHKT